MGLFNDGLFVAMQIPFFSDVDDDVTNTRSKIILCTGIVE